MTEHVLSRASGLFCQGNCREVEVCSRKMVTVSEIQLDEVNDLADKRDGRPMVRDSFSTENVSTIYVYEGVRRRDVTGDRVTAAEIVDRRSVCGDRALATKGTRDQEDYGGGSQHSNSQKHQNTFGIPLMADDEHPVTLLHIPTHIAPHHQPDMAPLRDVEFEDNGQSLHALPPNLMLTLGPNNKLRDDGRRATARPADLAPATRDTNIKTRVGRDFGMRDTLPFGF